MRLLRTALPLALLATVLPAHLATAAETTLVQEGATWRYDDNGTDLATTWRQAGYDDSTWATGTGQLGFGDGDETTDIARGATTYYFRKSFTVADASQVTDLDLSTLVDDGAVVYLNGHEVWRSQNLPLGQGFTSLTTSYVAGTAENDWTTAGISTSALVDGQNTLAVEVHQFNLTSSDVSFDLSLQASTATTATVRPTTPTVACKITDSRVKELSGLVASVRFPNILWANNDSGDVNRVFAIDATTCAVRAVVKLDGARYYDYEAISMGRDANGEPVMWVGDIGNNSRSRSQVQLYRFDEPTTLTDQTVAVKTVTVTWSDGARDSESMFVDPTPGGSVYLVSKEANGSGVYELQGDYRTTGYATTGNRIATTLATATDAAVAPDRSHTVMRNYTTKASLLNGIPGSNAQTVTIPSQTQGEAIAFSADSDSLYVASEGTGQPLWRVPV